jgi:hypothetical protein
MSTTFASLSMALANEPKFNLNQIVRGIRCGVFVILERNWDSQVRQHMYWLKEVNPANLAETAPGHLCLHEDAIKQY